MSDVWPAGAPLAACGDDSAAAAQDSAPPQASRCVRLDRRHGRPAGGGVRRGELKVSTDPAYPPQSSLNEKTGKYEGFDIDVATEVAHRLGVKVAWETPSWEVITAGSWNDRWQMSVGSMTPTNDRQKVLDFSQPYYYTPAVVVVNKDNTERPGPLHRPGRQEDRRLQRLHLRAVPGQEPGHQGLHVRLRDRRRRGLRLRHRHHRAAGPRARRRYPARRCHHVADDRAGLHRRRQPGEDRRRPGVLRAARGRDRQELAGGPRQPLPGGRQDRRRDARRRDASPSCRRSGTTGRISRFSSDPANCGGVADEYVGW